MRLRQLLALKHSLQEGKPIVPMSQHTSLTSELDGVAGNTQALYNKPLYSLNDTYKSCTVAVNPTRLRRTEFVVRKTNESHPSVAVWKEKFSRGAYGAGNAFISVAILGMPQEIHRQLMEIIAETATLDLHNLPPAAPSSVLEFIRENGVFYVDGMHRGVALRDPNVVHAMEQNQDIVHANLYYRKDSLPMRETDVISIGVLSSRSSKSVKIKYSEELDPHIEMPFKNSSIRLI